MEQPKMSFKEITNGDHKYQVYPITGRDATHLDRKVTSIAYTFRKDVSSQKELGLRVVQTFADMEDYIFDDIVEKSIPNVVRLGNDGETNVRVTIDNIYDIFKGDLDGLYGFLIELWEAYELTPFKKAKAASTGD